MGMYPKCIYWVGVNLIKLDTSVYDKYLEKINTIAEDAYLEYDIEMLYQSEELIGFGITLLNLDWDDGVVPWTKLEEAQKEIYPKSLTFIKGLNNYNLMDLIDHINCYIHVDYL